MKNFDSWNEEKKKINSSGIQKLFHERELWWASFGISIRVLDSKRLLRKINTMKLDEFNILKEKMKNLI